MTRPPSAQQRMMLCQSIENKIYRGLGKLAENSVTQQTVKGRLPRLEAVFRRLAWLIQHGFTPKTDEEIIIDEARQKTYFVDPSKVDYSDEEFSIFENLINEEDQSDPLEDILDYKKAGNEDLMTAITLVQKSMPKCFGSLPGFIPRKRIVGYVLEANQMIPACENHSFMYIVSHCLHLCNFLTKSIKLGATPIPFKVIKFQTWKTINWEKIDEKSDSGKLARKILDAQIAAENAQLRIASVDEINKALKTSRNQSRSGIMQKFKSLQIQGL